MPRYTPTSVEVTEEYCLAFWDVLARDGRFRTTSFIKNVLRYNHMATRDQMMLYKDTEDDFIEDLRSEIQEGVYTNTLRNEVALESIEAEPQNFYGAYYQNEANFEFSLGQKSDLRIILRLVTDETQSRLIKPGKWRMLKRLLEGTRSELVRLSVPRRDSIDFEVEEKKILSQIKNDRARKVKFDFYQKSMLDRIHVEFKFHEATDGKSTLHALVFCPLCRTQIKVSKMKKKTVKEDAQGWWHTTNFIDHYMKHKILSDENGEDAGRNSETANNGDRNVSVIEAEVHHNEDSGLTRANRGVDDTFTGDVTARTTREALQSDQEPSNDLRNSVGSSLNESTSSTPNSSLNSTSSEHRYQDNDLMQSPVASWNQYQDPYAIQSLAADHNSLDSSDPNLHQSHFMVQALGVPHFDVGSHLSGHLHQNNHFIESRATRDDEDGRNVLMSL